MEPKIYGREVEITGSKMGCLVDGLRVGSNEEDALPNKHA